jgi:hypothetical protein
MKIRKFEQYESPWEDDDDELYGRPHYGKNPQSDGDDMELEDDLEDDDMQHLSYLLRTMFRNSGFDQIDIETKGLDITIHCYLRKRERLKDIIKAFEVANKLKNDILAQYDSEFEMWETNEKDPILVFFFTYEEGLDDDKRPF